MRRFATILSTSPIRRRTGRSATPSTRRGLRSPTSKPAAAGRCSSAEPVSTCARSSTASRVPPRDLDVRAVLEPRDCDRRRAWRRAYERLALADPLAASRIEPGNVRRIVRALEVIEHDRPPVLVVRRPASTTTDRLRSTSVWSGSGCRGPSSAGASGSRPIRRRCATAGLRGRGPRALRPRPRRSVGDSSRNRHAGAVAHRGAGHWLQGVLAYLDGEIATLDERLRPGRAAHPPVRPAPAGLVPARPPHPLDRHRAKSRRPRGRCTGTLGAERPPRRCEQTTHDHTPSRQAARHRATTSSCGSRSTPPDRAARARDRRRSSATATVGIGADGLITIGPGDLRTASTARCAAERRRRRRRDERQRHPVPGVGRGPCRARHRARSSSSTPPRGRRDDRAHARRRRRRSSRPTSTWARSRLGERRPRDHARRRRVLGRRRQRRQSAPRVLRRSTPRRSPSRSHGPRIELDAALPAAHERRVRRASIRPTRSTCACGNGAWARRCRAAPARARPPRSRTTAASSTTHVTVRVPGGELDVVLGDTVRLGGPVVHVFDVDIEVP